MAEAGVVAAAYAAETVAEGAAVGAFAVAKSTTPLRVKFYKLPSPNRRLTRSCHTLTVVKGKAYIFGGDVWGQDGGDVVVHAITLPSDLELKDIDYQSIPPAAAPARPLANYGDNPGSSSERQKNAVPVPRAAHTAAAVDSTIYIFGGRPPSSTAASALNEQGTVHAFDATDKTWSTLTPHPTRCSSGIPCPRTHASTSSTPHPQSSGDHGTVFLHGGYDAAGKLLRDVWAFDVASRIWSRWLDIPSAGAEEIEGEGTIICTESRLWRCGDGFGKVVYLDLVRDAIDDFSGVGELGVSPKTGNWQTVSFGPITVSGEGSQDDDVEAKISRPGMHLAEAYPLPRIGAGFVPMTTGAGREYLLFFMGQEGRGIVMGDVWSFQIRSDKRTPAMLKDGVRRMVGMHTGEQTWAKADVVQSTKEDGPLELPNGLSRFGCGPLQDFGRAAVVLWGGITQGADVVGDGWIMVAD
jgi:hypothetical protein